MSSIDARGDQELQLARNGRRMIFALQLRKKRQRAAGLGRRMVQKRQGREQEEGKVAKRTRGERRGRVSKREKRKKEGERTRGEVKRRVGGTRRRGVRQELLHRHRVCIDRHLFSHTVRSQRQDLCPLRFICSLSFLSGCARSLRCPVLTEPRACSFSPQDGASCRPSSGAGYATSLSAPLLLVSQLRASPLSQH